jgi:hypothetical protein
MSVTSTLNGTLQLTDNISGSTTFLKQLLLSYAGSVSSFAQNLTTLSTSGTNIALPNGSAQFLYIRNLSTVAGTIVTVTWTPQSGSTAVVLNLSPGAAIIFSETNSSNGITSLNLQPSAVNTPVEYLIAS